MQNKKLSKYKAVVLEIELPEDDNDKQPKLFALYGITDCVHWNLCREYLGGDKSVTPYADGIKMYKDFGKAFRYDIRISPKPDGRWHWRIIRVYSDPVQGEEDAAGGYVSSYEIAQSEAINWYNNFYKDKNQLSE